MSKRHPIEALIDVEDNDNIILHGKNDDEIELEQIALIPYGENTSYAILKPVEPMEGVGEDGAIVFKLAENPEGEDVLSVEFDERMIDLTFHKFHRLLNEESEYGGGSQREKSDFNKKLYAMFDVYDETQQKVTIFNTFNDKHVFNKVGLVEYEGAEYALLNPYGFKGTFDREVTEVFKVKFDKENPIVDYVKDKKLKKSVINKYDMKIISNFEKGL